MHRLSPRRPLIYPLFAAFALLLSLSACEIINPAEEVPAYVSIRNAQILQDEDTGFTSSVGLKDIWLHHSAFLQGVYPINSEEDPDGVLTVPYLLVEDSTFFLNGGIFETGLSAFRIPYPFWDEFVFNIKQAPGDTTVIEPIIRYRDDSEIVYQVNEAFEGVGFSLVPFNRALNNTDSTGLVRRSDAFMGNFSGYVDFGPDDRWFEVINANPFFLQRDKDIYAEITYRSSINFQVGLVYLGLNGLFIEEVVTVTPSGGWNTIYVHLIEQVRNLINANGSNTQFWLWIFADGAGNEGFINLDNVRLIHQR